MIVVLRFPPLLFEFAGRVKLSMRGEARRSQIPRVRDLLLAQLRLGPEPSACAFARSLPSFVFPRMNVRSSWANADSIVSMAEAWGVLVLAHGSARDSKVARLDLVNDVEKVAR